MAYDNNQMGYARRTVLLSLLASALTGAAPQDPLDQVPPANRPPHFPRPGDDDEKLPNGKSQKDAIAKREHEQALKDADDLIAMAQQLKDELQKAGTYVVPMASLRRTEDIEKLARRIRGRLNR